MGWIDEFRSKRMSAEQAVGAVHSGNRVYVHEGYATPQPLVDALMGRTAELRDVEICHMLTFGEAAYTRAEYEGHFRHNGLFLGNNVRAAVHEGRADYTPIFLSEIENRSAPANSRSMWPSFRPGRPTGTVFSVSESRWIAVLRRRLRRVSSWRK